MEFSALLQTLIFIMPPDIYVLCTDKYPSTNKKAKQFAFL
jgi:hypothetical protein